MPEPFCKTEPPSEHAQNFVAAVNARRADEVDRLLKNHPELQQDIDAHWFSFDSPAVVAAKDSEAVLRVLLQHGADLNNRSSWWAGSFGVLDGVSSEQAQFLVERGARLDVHSAAEQGKFDLVRDFLDADSQLVNARGGDGQTPLHVASTIEIVDLLLDRGADASIRCLDHSATAAQYAVSNPEICRHLIMRGSTPDIFMATAIGDRELVEQILREDPDSLAARIGSCKHTKPIDSRSHLHIYFWKLLGAATPLAVAREFDHRQLYEELFRRSPASQKFLAACWVGERELVAELVAETPNVFSDLNADEQKTMSRAAWEGRLEAVRVMLEFGFDPHLPGDENSTPLDRAAFHGYREVVELLLESDPHPPLEFKNRFGGVPLGACVHGATHSWKQNTDHVGTARALIKAGSKIDPNWLPVKNEAINRLFEEHMGTE